ncbi:c-type cytochrome [Nitrococcus mobilis]|uniref:Cytochrome c4 n=1 Tax=Nitrococcus mobilis Nb-231 TaxID=314278 RepID=A4BNY0_9GAMM|nr:c-type cytochrome [Nitrococcus mobilis]EAR22929.1 cytochrome c4 precursor [Nitrococcus mobilis Nb-231]
MLMKHWIAFLALIPLSAGVMAFEGGNPQAGQQKAAVCAGCHGSDGNSPSGQFPSLAGQHASYLYEQLRFFKSGQRKNPIMQPQAANLSDPDMQDLAAYFAGQTLRIGVADKALVEQGEQLFRGGLSAKGVPACTGCHGPAGMGNPPARYPRISGQKAAYLVQQLQDYRAGKRSDYPRGKVMQGVAAELTDKEIEALASFLSGLHLGNQPAN